MKAMKALMQFTIKLGKARSLACGLVTSLLFVAPLSVSAQEGAAGANDAPTQEVREASSLEQLLELIRDRRLHWSTENAQREKKFAEQKANQNQLLNDAKAERARQERISDRLEATFDANEVKIGNLQEQLNNRLGSLRELFGVLQQVAGDTRGVFQSSIVSAQLPDREQWLEEFAQKMGESSQLATIEEMKNLWVLLQEQMTATGQIATFPALVTAIDGEQQETRVTRLGAFNLVSDEEYVNYNADTKSIVALARQPSSRFSGTTSNLTDAAPGELVAVAIDPTRGSLLSLLIQSKTVVERIQDGGSVGAVIIVLGFIGILLALTQWVYLTQIGGRMRKQVADIGKHNILANNPLGRVLRVGLDNRNVDVETLELKLSEAVLGETPKLTRFLPIVQVISVVSPLLGLLGTVIGMILTFQAITLFGTGDPQTMAGGISTALMTTVLGLCAAIPTVLLHAVVSSRSRSLIHILEEQSTGIVAQQAERANKLPD